MSNLCYSDLGTFFRYIDYSPLSTSTQEINEEICGETFESQKDPTGIYSNTYNIQNGGYVFERIVDNIQLAKNPTMDRWDITTLDNS